MAYFRKLRGLQGMVELFSRPGNWLIFVNADPDAMASAMALKRIMSRKVDDVAITRINEVTRPDNLAMIRYTRIHMLPYTPSLPGRYAHYALVDSQPHHSPLFQNIPFSIIIDHHPLPGEPAIAAYRDIRPEYGATSTMMTEHLYNLGMRPGKHLATALQFGIKSDTSNFERKFTEVDLRAYNFLARFAAPSLLSRIARSEFHMRWLDYFARACVSMYAVSSGQFVFLDTVENPDILVVVADFLMRVYEIRWVAVSGIYGDTAVVIFRGDGIIRDLGTMANLQFGDIGSAGGHRAMARAEFPVDAANGKDMESFIYKRVSTTPRKKPHSVPAPAPAPAPAPDNAEPAASATPADPPASGVPEVPGSPGKSR